MKTIIFGTTLIALTASPAFAGKPVKIGENITITPSLDGRMRYESVVQANALDNAEALTVRARPGLTLGVGKQFSFLVEGEGTFAISENYNSTTNGRIGYSTVADPENFELNRLQLQYKSKQFTATAGRQRINIDDQRFVGSVGWRDNEQTFDAVRGEAMLGPIALDATYAWSQRTIFGAHAGAREHFDGNYIFLGAGGAIGPVKLKAFSYLLDYDAGQPVSANSTQTYGLRATSAFKLSPKVTLNFAASFASQSDYKANPADFAASYIAAETGLTVGNYGLVGGYELLGADGGRSFQTPFATLHKFNGWADMFLTTPTQGLEDVYVGSSAKFPSVKMLPGLNAAVTWHYFHSDTGAQKFGKEWDAQIGFKVAKVVNLLFKYADFDRTGIAKFAGDVSTRKFWLQAEIGL